MKKLLIGLFLFGFLLVGSQVYAAITPSITVLSPNGGEVYQAGQQIVVKWQSANIPTSENLTIRLFKSGSHIDGGGQFTILSNGTPNDGIQTFILGEDITSGQYQLDIRGNITYDISDNTFTINPATTTPSITVLSPNGGETYQAGQQVTVKWKTENIPTSDRIQISLLDAVNNQVGDIQVGVITVTNNGQTVFTLPATNWDGTSISNGEKYKLGLWTANGEGSSTYKDYSDNLFTINPATTTPSITVLSPNGGETYTAGQQITIKWKSQNIPNDYYVAIQLMDDISNIDYKDNGRQLRTINDGQETFTIPVDDWDGTRLISGKRYKIGIWTAMGEGSIQASDWSDNLFTITSINTNTPVISGVSGPQALNVNQTGTWKVTAYDPSGGTLSYSVDWGDDTTLVPNTVASFPKQASQQSATFSHTYSQTGTYNTAFIITNNSGQSANTSLSVKIINQDTSTLPTGCTSTSGYSPITGEKCDGIIRDIEGCIAGYNFSPITGARCPEIVAIRTCSSSGAGCGSANITNSSPTSISRTLKKGIKGDDVKILQLFLNLAADGSFGPQTQQKVMEWQLANGLTPDGAFGVKSATKAGLAD